MAQRYFAVLTLAAMLGCTAPVAAQWAVAAAPSNPQLDAMLAAKQWNTLGTALANPPDLQNFSRETLWMRNKLESGASFFITMIYAKNMWLSANGMSASNPALADQGKFESGAATLYALDQIVIDGTMCQDQTAVSHRMDQLIQARAATLQYLKSLPAARKQAAVDSATKLEASTAARRGEDALLCSDGMAQMQAGIKAGTTQTLPAGTNGMVGRVAEVKPPAGWQPSFNSPSAYLPKQRESREKLPALLLKLIG